MDSFGNTWAIVLAGGDGTRLQSLTTNLNGVPVPKQYCSIWDGPSLIEGALERATAVAPLRRICAVVASAHRRWWSTSLGFLPNENVIVQPRNRGTGIGILLSLLCVHKRDPFANIVLMPADNYLQDESTMALSLRGVADLAAADTGAVYLLGANPSGSDPILGYVVPAEVQPDGSSSVATFVEKPSMTELPALLEQGALVNVFIVAGSVGALLGLYQASYAHLVDAFDEVIARSHEAPNHGPLFDAYEGLAPLDFSQDILQHNVPSLRVVPVPPCGWFDLGTPERVAQLLKQPAPKSLAAPGRAASLSPLSLSTQWLGRE